MSRIIWHPLNDTDPDIGWRYLDTSCDLMMPWYTIGCLEWLVQQNLSEMSVFEYGCGISSTWWRQHCKVWKGVDHNPKWANGGMVPLNPNGTINDDLYIKAPLGENYDIVVIDGLHRDQCVPQALSVLNPNGHIIIDNWDQPSVGQGMDSWPRALVLLKDFKKAVHKQPTHDDWKTAIFSR